ncbi:hypothetical protein H5119_02235 [Pseudoalteromonas sp. SG45-5]|uniref:hypothetical protein n=1 Tax=unclassified Pseudoalteromonas TaxID=194690 RepID=UPI0015F814D0|nr:MULTISPECIES: hypothetical protein [unclassified Pseudoalteromonas]MBB1384379.1 hypothetical protein [Pseudoalteromonas sp. SG45-5]MBB1392333.1 hypothetical protein [Pseudoalteromonas sp. SG44-4]MBB1446808.1 hypothetical protein [Pseudoalteromonas sp. SG41-6]
MNIQELLIKISQGVMSYKPESDSLEDLKPFQEIVGLLKFAEKEGYIVSTITQKECRYPGGLICNIVVRGGLTDNGKSFISNI